MTLLIDLLELSLIFYTYLHCIQNTHTCLIKGIEQRDLITKGAILNFIMKCEENYKEELK